VISRFGWTISNWIKFGELRVVTLGASEEERVKELMDMDEIENNKLNLKA
jgi:hypothetical protein